MSTLRPAPAGLIALLITLLLLAVSFNACDSGFKSKTNNYQSLLVPDPNGKRFTNSYSYRANKVLDITCSGCHSADANSSLKNVLDVEALVINGFIRAGDPENSPLYVAIASAKMPPPNSAGVVQHFNKGIAIPTSVSDEDKKMLHDWILTGDVPQSFPDPLPSDPTFSQLKANIFDSKCNGCHHFDFNSIRFEAWLIPIILSQARSIL